MSSHPVFDTSAFIIQYHKRIVDYPIYTTFSVLDELDKLKDSPRVGLRARLLIHDIVDGLEFGTIKVYDVKAETTDLSVIELLKELNGTVYTTDIGLYLRLITALVKANLLHETHPENIVNAIKHVHVDTDLSGDYLEIDLPYSDFTYMFVDNGYGSRIGKYVNGKIEFIDKQVVRVSTKKVESLCAEQTMLIDLIRDIRLPMLCAIGPAGSGKTFITILTLLQLVREGVYEKMVILVPPVQLGGYDRYGYLPGTLEEKTIAQFSGIIDNINYLLEDEGKLLINNAVEGNEWSIEIQSFANIRGRSIKRAIIIIDELQNTHLHELKTFITRVDMGSKIILLGDISQIDTNFTSNENNGLIYVADRMYDSNVSTNITLTRVHRSLLVQEALKRLF